MRNRPSKILQHPHRILSRQAEPIRLFDEKLMNTLKRLFYTLQAQTEGNRLGLAAPQIGVSKRVFIALNRVFINPEMDTHAYEPNYLSVEACYSAPNRVCKVWRYKTLTARWKDSSGNERTEKLRGTLAIVFQHELNHLEGLCCVDVGEEISSSP